MLDEFNGGICRDNVKCFAFIALQMPCVYTALSMLQVLVSYSPSHPQATLAAYFMTDDSSRQGLNLTSNQVSKDKIYQRYKHPERLLQLSILFWSMLTKLAERLVKIH